MLALAAIALVALEVAAAVAMAVVVASVELTDTVQVPLYQSLLLHVAVWLVTPGACTVPTWQGAEKALQGLER